MGSCVSSKGFTNNHKKQHKSAEKEKKQIAKEKRIIITNKIRNAPILKLEGNELYTKRKKPFLASQANCEIGYEMCIEVTKINTNSFTDRPSPLFD
ncbi:unnamed protein product [Blepharisma stoltei]|uniref:Uncharacterized protein n=1 Tax=Blepharisma stoltei TaxID=1481888 RepID=A0AAU9JTP6_9CILI|nr:unnamed protein product [Blepharisma stoltei]